MFKKKDNFFMKFDFIYLNVFYIYFIMCLNKKIKKLEIIFFCKQMFFMTSQNKFLI